MRIPDTKLWAQDAYRAVADRAVELWGARPEQLEHIVDSGNFVYRIRGEPGSDDRILRLTDPAYRTRENNRAELEFLAHLAGCGVSVSTGVPSLSGQLIETIEHEGSGLWASVFTWAPGIAVDPDSPCWNREFLRTWGRTLGAIHRAAGDFAGAGRWHWRDEVLLREARALIPADEGDVLTELDSVLDEVASWPETPKTFGMNHADFAPVNFHYDRQRDRITVFDFGNACSHYFASDLVITLDIAEHMAQSSEPRQQILAGYAESFAIDPDFATRQPWLRRLRTLYVYLSRLWKFGPAPSPEQSKRLGVLRRRVVAGS